MTTGPVHAVARSLTQASETSEGDVLVDQVCLVLLADIRRANGVATQADPRAAHEFSLLGFTSCTIEVILVARCQLVLSELGQDTIELILVVVVVATVAAFATTPMSLYDFCDCIDVLIH